MRRSTLVYLIIVVSALVIAAILLWTNRGCGPLRPSEEQQAYIAHTKDPVVKAGPSR